MEEKKWAIIIIALFIFWCIVANNYVTTKDKEFRAQVAWEQLNWMSRR